MKLTLSAAYIIANILMPPAQYDHKPTEKYRVKINDLWIEIFCPEAWHLLACTDLDNNTIYLSSKIPDKALDIILRHEFAHINGWNPTHSN